MELTKAQRSWLQAHADKGSPISMFWLDENHQSVSGPPETWVYLVARWESGATRTLHADERAALAPHFEPGTWSITPAGRAALKDQGEGR